MNDAWKAVRAAFVAGVIFAVLEACSAYLYPVALDPQPTLFAVGLSVAGTGLLLAVAALLLSTFSPRHAAGLSLAVWAAVWGPQQAQIAGWHRVGWAPSVVLGSTALVAPGLAVVVGAFGGVTGAIFRRRGDRAGLVPMSRPEASTKVRPNLLLVTVDGVRADAALMNAGQWRSDSLFSPVQGWTHFTQAISAAPWSLPSMHSVMTSKPVREHGGGLSVGDTLSRRLSDAIPVPYTLQQAGYETYAVVSNPYLSVEQGFADGFDGWSHVSGSVEPVLLLHYWNRFTAWVEGSAGELSNTKDQRIVTAAIDRLGQVSERPRFVWVHLVGPAEYVRGLDVEITGSSSPADVEAARAAYLSSVAATRVQLKRLGRAAPGWVVAIVSSHGVSMGDDGRWGSGQGLSDDQLHVPLAIRRPNTQGGVVARQVAAADVGHTLLAAAGLGRFSPGQHLLKARLGPIEVGGVAQKAGLYAARTNSAKYIKREPGVVGPGVQRSDQTMELLDSSGLQD